ncbi:uncharacterized protein L969DRAFT_86587 [Mixia osmundae IAM 14324]|uniref:uncharacterized protein n=1 Tax=Mixia osmundae (strain CBS 9802 / IAM 14324 / JCM 22182 / KY 12970) TaxID=764103 RepID=UPI0004A55584|nr:uncharacterized protein L969DRAFT_86587 [Mixia osmundae IAM 14324]KEI39979.1 hypothetical protein L969DRAFT_86587 [Mixia osmundae IAM 14324]
MPETAKAILSPRNVIRQLALFGGIELSGALLPHSDASTYALNDIDGLARPIHAYR